MALEVIFPGMGLTQGEGMAMHPKERRGYSRRLDGD